MKRRQTLLPGNVRNAVVMEVPVLMSLSLLGTENFGRSQYTDLLLCVLYLNELTAQTEDQGARRIASGLAPVLYSMAQRYELTKKWGVNGDEWQRIKSLIPEAVQLLRKVPNHVLHKVMTTVLRKQNVQPKHR